MKYKFPSLSEELKLMKEKPAIYSYEILTNNTQVLIFGVQHTRDSNHPQFHKIKEKIKEFSPDAVLFEVPNSAENLFYSKDTDKSLKRMGEVKIINDILPKKVKRICADNVEGNLLKSGLGKSEDREILDILIKTGKICSREGIPVKKFIQDELKKRNNLDLFERIIDYIKELTREDIEDIKDPKKIIPAPIGQYCKLNSLMRKFSLKRDEEMINRLLKETKNSKRIIFFVGRNHALRWEKVLRNFQKN